jgi:C-terminal processing protease CtpA/Prc
MPAFPILRARLGLASGLAILVAFLATSMDPCPAGQGSYPLGDLGGRAALADNQLQITALLPSQPGDAAGLKIGDVITGVAGMPFATGYLMPLRQLGTALDDAQGRDGGLRLGILRAGRQQEIMVRLPRTGRV